VRGLLCVKVAAAVKMMYKRTSEEPATQATAVHSLSTRISDATSLQVTHPATEAGTGATSDAMHMNTCNRGMANAAVEDSTLPTDDANSVQQSQREVCSCTCVCACVTVL